MDITQNSIFSLAERRLRWLDNWQVILASNMANLDTPGFIPQDQPDFITTLSRSAGTLVRTDPRHLAGEPPPTDPQQEQNPRSPDGNEVTLEDQLVKVADTDSSQSLTTAIYKDYVGMFGLALGHSSS